MLQEPLIPDSSVLVDVIKYTEIQHAVLRWQEQSERGRKKTFIAEEENLITSNEQLRGVS